MHGIKVLIVDDSMFFREAVSRGLMANLPSGSRVDKASDPFEARDKIMSFDPDVMVLDVEMPKMNGIEFLRRLIVQYALPTIVLSSRPAYRGIAMEAGAYGFMPKPSTTAGLSFMKELAASIELAYEKNQMLINQAQSGAQPELETDVQSDLQSHSTQTITAAQPANSNFAANTVNSGQLYSNSSSHNSILAGAISNTNVRNGDMARPERPMSPLRAMLQKAKEDSEKRANKAMSPSMGVVVDSMRQLSEAAKQAELRSGHTKVSAKVPAVAPKPKRPINLIAIGASTGGTEALATVLRALQPPLPPIVIVQHIPPMFSRLFAERLENECHIHVKEAANGDKLQNDWAYIAPGDQQMEVRSLGNMMSLDCFYGEKVNGHCPSVDVLFNSVAERVGDSALGVILTGMGADGAKGMLKMRQAGSITLGQDEASCVVYGMPKAAYEMGAVSQQLPLDAVAGMITAIAGYQRGR